MQVAPFKIIVDTREQLPFRFENMRDGRRKVFVFTRRKGLQTGDYSIEGYENKICVERKSLQDAYQTFIHERERFVRELERMKTFDICKVIIEAEWREIACPELLVEGWYSGINPNSIIASIVHWQREYPHVHFTAAGDRATAEKKTFHFLQRYWKEKQGALHENRKEIPVAGSDPILVHSDDC
jgi:ERCC4-type nuclease